MTPAKKRKPKPHPSIDCPTLDEYLKAAHRLATLVRKAFDTPHSVKRSTLKRALQDFERVDMKAM